MHQNSEKPPRKRRGKPMRRRITTPLPDVFTFLDYREFLQQAISVKKTNDPSFTMQTVAETIGITYKGFISNVIKGRKNLNSEQAEGIGKALKLNAKSIRCFKLLVTYNQSTTIEEKKNNLDRLLALKQVKSYRLQNNQLDFFSKWYIVIIRDMLHYVDIKDNYEELSQMLYPAILPKEAEEAINALEGMQLISRNEVGVWKPTDRVVSAGDEVNSIQLLNYQLTTMDMAKEALKKLRAKERDISYASLTLSEENFSKVREEIRNFRKRILDIAKTGDTPDRVFQCNIQLFPMTQKSDLKHEDE